MGGFGLIFDEKTDDLVYPQEESDLHFSLRRGVFYPLNYED